MLRKINTNQLRLGMYVASLDRPWVETSFVFQGLKLERLEDIRYLQQKCEYVYIDEDRSDVQSSAPPSTPVRKPKNPVEVLKKRYGRLLTYQDQSTAEDEMDVAKRVYREAEQAVQRLWTDLDAGRPIQVPAVRATVSGVLDSVLRNPDAFMWLRMLKSRDDYTYRHAIDSCSLAAAFGRQLGIPKQELSDLAMGALLLDIGKTKIPAELLNRAGELNEEEMVLVRSHVERGVALLREAGNVPAVTIEMVYTHHERFNGAGYPQGLSGASIPISGRMAAIIDCYDAITSDRPYRQAIASHEAVRLMYEWRNIDFQEELIEHFIQCLGVYPTGSLVELNSGEVGIVYAQNRLRRLRPKLLLVLDKDKQPYGFSPTLDLMTTPESADGTHLEIVRSVNATEFGINPADYYL